MQTMGFTEAESGFVIQAADYRRREKQVVTTVSAVRARFIAHHLDQNQASAILDKSGLLAAQTDILIATCKKERSALVTNLTEAQGKPPMKKKAITIEKADPQLAA